ncbi:variable large family protein (plasmid) [Borreliella burgdorferi]
MMKAAEKAAAAGDGNSKIGDVANAGGGTGGNDASVKGIALGIKGIVDAAGNASGEKGGGGALKGVKEATGNSNADAGKLFDTNGGGRRAGAADVGKASDAVSAVSGKQIIKAIVDAAEKGDHAGAAAGTATNPIAAAIVLRGLAKGGKFAATDADAGAKDGKKGDAVTSVVQEVNKWLEEMMKAAEKAAAAGDTGNSKIGDVANAAGGGAGGNDASVKGIAEGIKGIVDAAGKASGEDGGSALKGVEEAADNNNGDAGKLFATSAGGGNRANAADVGKASDAVSAVSGKQIIKAIVDAAEKGGHAGAAAGAAKNPIAAAIVLRGLAKNGKFAADSADGAKSAKDGKKGDAVTSVVQEVNKWLEEMMKAAEKAAAVGDTGKSKIGDVAHGAGGGAGGNDASVKGIAEGIKGIVDAAGKASGENGGGGALKSVEEATDKNNADAGKLFATQGGRQAGAADVGKASDAVSAVSGKQIIKAIVDAAGKASGEKDGDALKGVKEAAAKNNGDAGKLFATSAGGRAGAADVGKASDAVSAVSGKQIIKAIVDAAGKASGENDGGALKGVEEAAAGAATNPIAAAIGQARQNGAAFNNNDMKKDDKIAAAIVLRGLAKGGKFAADSADNAKSAKDGKKGDAVTSVVQEVNKWLEEMMKAAEKAAAAGDTGNSKIGDVANGAGTKANDASVKGIAEGIKGIVDAAGNASGEDGGGALKGVKEAAGNSNADAGKLFATQGGRQAGAADVGKASDAVSAVSGKQIIKAIVDAAGNGGHTGAAAGTAKNPIAAAIGQAGQAGAAFVDNNMKKDDKIAAAIVLRGLAKDGKFAAANADGAKSAKDGKKGDAVTSVVQEVNKWLEEMMKAAEKAAAVGDAGKSKIGDVANAAAGAGGNDASVKGIALGIKGIVDAAGNASGENGGGGALKGVKEATGNNNGDAGKLFATSAGGRQAGAADVGKASDAVSAVSGKQIIKAIVDAAGKGGHAGAAAGNATNPIAAAIGQANQAGAAFVDNNMKKDDKIAAAIVLRGLAKDGKFAATDENGAKSAKSVIESARKLTNG